MRFRCPTNTTPSLFAQLRLFIAPGPAGSRTGRPGIDSQIVAGTGVTIESPTVDGESTRKALEKALAIDPAYPEALNNLGIAFGNEGDLTRAEARFERALKARPDYPQAANNLAILYAATGPRDQDLEILSDSIERTPSFEPSYFTLARIYRQSGEQSQAIRTLWELLRHNPRQIQVLRLLEQLGAKNAK